VPAPLASPAGELSLAEVIDDFVTHDWPVQN
jgi:hypothetical protein